MKKEFKKVIQFTNELYSPVKKIKEKEFQLDKYDNVASDGILSFENMEFNMSFCFDEVNLSKSEKFISLMNFFYLDVIDEENKAEKLFPTIKKLKKEVEGLRKKYNDYDHIVIGENYDDELDVGLNFKTFIDFKNYALNYEKAISLYEDLINEIEVYLNNRLFIDIENSGIKEIRSNGGRIQEILFKSDKNLFKISIKSEGHDFQSYAKLKILNKNKDWTVIISKNPLKDYGINISYKNDYRKDEFQKIILDLKRIAEEINSIGEE